MADLKSRVQSFLLMGTVVSVRLVGETAQGMDGSLRRAEQIMRSVEQTLSRFDEESELRRLCRTQGVLVAVTPMLYRALEVALHAAALTEGTFDPTVGRRMEELGFDRHYLTGKRVKSTAAEDEGVSFRDVTLLEARGEVRLERPMTLDLGAVAKGLAVDLAARALSTYEGVAIDAGGDVFVRGIDPHGEPWRVGIEHPQDTSRLLRELRLQQGAVCTSGSYRRKSPSDSSVHHLLDARTGRPSEGLLSMTVVGPQAMVADVAATCGFLLGPDRALSFIEELGLEGLYVAPDLTVGETGGMGALSHGGQTFAKTLKE